MIDFRLTRDGAYADVVALDEHYKLFADFVNDDLFGREGVERQLEITRAVLAGTFAERHGDGTTESRSRYEREYNLFHIAIGPSKTTISLNFRDESAEVATSEYAAFLEELLSVSDDDE